jgi:hypothetical protein
MENNDSAVSAIEVQEEDSDKFAARATKIYSAQNPVLPDGPTTRGAATSWRVYLASLIQEIVVLPLVGR